MYKILPVNEPVITSYPVFANPLSIIQDNQQGWSWIISNFIQVVCPKPDSLTLNFKNYSESPILCYQHIKKSLINSRWEDIAEFIIDSIDMNNYVYMIVDQHYLSASDAFQRLRCPHDIFIYGYDSCKKIFNVADNMKSGKYVFSTCSFDELKNAYNMLPKDQDTIYPFNPNEGFNQSVKLLSLNAHIEYKFNINYVIKSLLDYLESKLTMNEIHQYRESHSYGISTYADVCEYVYLLEKNQVDFDIRSFHLIYEHKKLMRMRVDFLKKTNFLKDINELIEQCQKLETETLMIRNLALKYYINKKVTLLTDIVQRLEVIKELDYHLGYRILNALLV
ncbi:hypothetical protein [Paenibacillus senegalimassiliensis]|uniref:hypothetical protein n=1 Tax=Paenibacillus senegalimassiliensis TaxID=1737426 RepID=UPI00073E7C21|nr:hypothetical protein [Paenibacillus senegalimassiliensis]